MLNHARLVVCVVSPQKPADAPSFIRAHLERLPVEIKVLYGGSVASLKDGGEKGLQPPFTVWRHAGQGVSRRLFHRSWEDLEIAPLRQYLLENGVDAVLAEYGPTGAIVMNACQQGGVPLIVHFHGYDAYEEPTLERVGHLYPAMFRIAAAIIAVSHHMEAQLLKLGACRERLHYNPYGVETDVFKGADPAQVPPDFLAVGRYVDKKAPYLTLMAFRQVLDRVPEARLVMVGDGPLWETCQRLARALQLDTSVEFLGRRPHAEVARLMRQARAFVQHSVRAQSGDSEGTPLAVLEAGASGLPVVATRHAGIREVVIDGETGLLVDEGDVDGMAQFMIQLAEDPALAARLGRAAQQRVRSEFSIEKSMENLWRIIRTAVGDG